MFFLQGNLQKELICYRNYSALDVFLKSNNFFAPKIAAAAAKNIIPSLIGIQGGGKHGDPPGGSGWAKRFFKQNVKKIDNKKDRHFFILK